MRALNAHNTELADAANRLAADNTALRRRVDELRGPEAAGLEAEIARSRAELAGLENRLTAGRSEVTRARAEAEQIRADSARAATDAVRRAQDEERAASDAAQQRQQVVERAAAEAESRLLQLRGEVTATEDVAMLQQTGIYEFRHRLADAVAYKDRLEQIKVRYKHLVRQDQAVLAASGWTVNGSAAEGRKMIRDYTKLMLRAYNAEVDAAVRTMRPHRLVASIERLTKARDTIARLGKTMNIEVAPAYHQARVEELELTADHLAQVEEEKERARAERERLRDEAAAQKEMAKEREKLLKEQAHWQALALRAEQGAVDQTVAADAAEALERIEGSLEELSVRANPGVGTVYVISNVGAFGENIIKVGVTRREKVEERVRELGDASVPFKFDLHAAIFTTDAFGLENQLHKALAHRRVNRVNMRREFFYATPSEVRDILSHTDHARFVYEYKDEPDAEEWRTSQQLAGVG
ncbi:DUF4041 domain-containing protein [Actinomycetospora sp. CA-053990]|uniref:DUF4041 domain-containing protein n=1 Tax=Actinomycetospora sp. CA-053990 TaxID=3239891 RepID=UPI003D8DA303